MTAKEYLSQLKGISEGIRARKERVEELRGRCESVGAIRYDKDKVQSSGNNLQEELLAKLIDLQVELQEEMLKYEKKKNEIIRAIEKLSNVTYRAVLVMRYCEGKSWERISEELHFNYNYTRGLLKRAHEAFEKEILGG